MIYAFADFELDRGLYELRQRGQPVSLEPQVFEVLAHLVEHRDCVVTKEQLLDEIWGTRFVTPSALTTRIKQVRRALGDDGRSQRFIRTFTGRGYRFAADVVVARGPEDTGQAGDDSGTAASPPLVGREAELALLRALFEEATSGQRRVVLIAGDAGHGKTTLLEAFTATLTQQGGLRVAVGQAVEQGGAGEPYLPVLDAVARLCRQPGGREVVDIMRRQAPIWLLQLPGLVTGEDLEALRTATLGATSERMLRELVEAVEALCAVRPVVFVLEDVHWADRATLAVVAALARRSVPARLLLAVTYRPDDPDGVLSPLVGELAARRPTCRQLVLGPLDERALSLLVRERTGAEEVPADLVTLLAKHGGGSPLFVTTLVDHWMAAGLVEARDGRVEVPGGYEQLTSAVPADLRLLIEHQVAALPADDRDLVMACAVAGSTAPAAAVAAALDADEDKVDDRLHDVAARSGILVADDPEMWPDGTVTSVFRFRHSLYEEVLYAGLPARRRVRLHQGLGERLLTGFGDRSERAADLARHFVRSGDVGRAVPALLASARVALGRSAHVEAVDVLEDAKAQVARMDEGDERTRWDADVHAMLAPALVAVHGWAAPEVRDTYERALQLCRLLPEQTPIDAVLYGLATLHEYRAEYDRSQELTEHRLRRHGAESTSATQVEAHELLACSSFHQGGFEDALRHAETAVAAYNAGEHLALMALHGENPGVSSRHWAAHALWFLGLPDQSLAMMQEALALASDLAHAFSLAHAHEHAAVLHQYRLEPKDVLTHAEVTVRLADEQGYAYRRATGTMLRGWAVAARGLAAGRDELLAGLDAYRATGAAMDLPYFLALAADLHIRAGRLDDASAALDEARTIPRGRAYYYEPELLRLRAELLYRRGHDELAARAGGRAVEVAGWMHARSLELRAAISAAEHAPDGPAREAALDVVRRVRDSFTEGVSTPDLRRARALLQPLGADA